MGISIKALDSQQLRTARNNVMTQFNRRLAEMTGQSDEELQKELHRLAKAYFALTNDCPPGWEPCGESDCCPISATSI